MLLALASLVLLSSGFIARRLGLSPATKRRLLLIGGVTVVTVVGLSWMRLGPFSVVAALVGLGLAAQQAMQEIGRRGDFQDFGDTPPSPRPASGGMARSEALAVLGLTGDPDGEAVAAAHKRMILRAHPDQGGSDYLAAKVNEAKQVLLRQS